MFNQLIKLSKHSIVYGLGVAATQLIGFLLLPIYTRYLTPADYGALEILTSTQNILLILFVMGINTAVFVSYFSHESLDSRKTVISTALIYLTTTSSVLLIFLILFANNVSFMFFHSADYTLYFQLVFVTVFFDTLITIPQSIFRAKEESRKFVIVSLSRMVPYLILNVYLVVFLKQGILGILESGAIVSSIVFIALLPLIVKEINLKFSIKDLKEMLHFGLPLVPSNLGSWVLNLADRYFLLFFSTASLLGIYSIGYKFGLALQGLIVAPFLLAWGPFYWSIHKQKNAKDVYSLTLTYFVFVSMFFALSLSVLSKELIVLTTTPAYYDSYKIIPLVALSSVFFGCYSILGVGYGLRKKTKYSAIIMGLGVIVNLISNYLLIPIWGIMGAAVSTLISYGLLPIGSFIASRRLYPINYEWKRISKVFFVAFLLFNVSFFINFDSILISGSIKCFLLILYPFILYCFKFFKEDEIDKIKYLIYRIIKIY